MMDILSNLKYAAGSRKKRKRVARGEGSGHGGTATRGMNGQLSRSGAKKKIWFEGGQMPLQRRVPKFGFTNIFKKELKKLGLINNVKKPVKILGNGEFKVKVQLEVSEFSNSAKDKIEAAGGSIKKI